MSVDLRIDLPDVDGTRSSSAFGRAVVGDALRSVDALGAAAVERETNWRRGYPTHFKRLIEAVVADPAAASRIARAGLASVQERMQADLGTERRSLAALLDTTTSAPQGALTSQTVSGTAAPETEFTLPFDGRRLRGDELRAQLATWTSGGVLEPGVEQAVAAVIEHPEWLSLPGKSLVALGASAEMGPLRSILRWGGHVVAVDLPRPALWRDVLTLASESAGTLTYPVGGVQSLAAGADLLHDLPEVTRWISEQDGHLVLGNYLYADGVVNLRLAGAADALTTHLQRTRGDLSMGWLATPTDTFAVPGAAVAAATAEYERRTTLRRLRPATRMASRGRLLQRNYAPGEDPGINDSIVPQQGPNYLLAKRIHRWRATAARADGIPVSMNVAPPTRTRSVLKNRLLAAAYAGAHRFGVTVFAPSTSAALMAALLVHDLYADPAPQDTAWGEEAVRAVHGGCGALGTTRAAPWVSRWCSDWEAVEADPLSAAVGPTGSSCMPAPASRGNPQLLIRPRAELPVLRYAEGREAASDAKLRQL